MFHRTFPYFLWLLRDVTQAIPRDCKDLKDYFLKMVRRAKLKNIYIRQCSYCKVVGNVCQVPIECIVSQDLVCQNVVKFNPGYAEL